MACPKVVREKEEGMHVGITWRVEVGETAEGGRIMAGVKERILVFVNGVARELMGCRVGVGSYNLGLFEPSRAFALNPPISKCFPPLTLI